jgi:agmatinase
LDLHDDGFGDIYRYGIGYDVAHPDISDLNKKAMGLVEKRRLGEPIEVSAINEISCQVSQLVGERILSHRKNGQWVGILGGDHSCPLALMEILGREEGPFGILHIDAHHDLRKAYEGHTFSHASIMYNALAMVPEITRLVQVGIRDFSFEEQDLAKNLWPGRVEVFYDRFIQQEKFAGRPYWDVADQILSGLPDKVYVSFDIDGLDPTLCPGTGTPVPGGLAYQEALGLLSLLVKKGKKIIGFDLCEVGPQSWDLNVGARLLYQLSGSLLFSNRL